MRFQAFRRQALVFIALLITLPVTAGCGSSSEKKQVAAPPEKPNVAPTVVTPLASTSDLNDFASHLQLVRNPHVLNSARYLYAEAAKGTSNNAKAPNGSSDVQIQAYPLRAALWDSPVIEACWENPGPSFAMQMLRVRQAIAETWQAASKLQFNGWLKCPGTSPSAQQVVRIQIDDSDPKNGPRTLGLGKQLAGVTHGMLLNFTFLRWGTNCQTMTDYCIKAIAVHEFGHAIGFAHEQNRPDKPGECMDAPQGANGDDTMLTPYDPHSVMNYCNKAYNNDGQLSDLDKQAVQQLYGAHE
jgi:hypothetical protein